MTWCGTRPLFILPIGLGLFGRSAPPSIAATMIAAWFLAAFFGNLGAGALGTLWSAMPPWQFFIVVAAVATLASALLFALVPMARPVDPGRRSEPPLRAG